MRVGMVLAASLLASLAAPTAQAASLGALACCTGKLGATTKLAHTQIACPIMGDPGVRRRSGREARHLLRRVRAPGGAASRTSQSS